MRGSFRIGTVAGVPVAVNWSVLIVFALITAGLSAFRFPNAYPGRPTWTYLAAGLGAGLVFFLGLLAHEVSHAVVAIRDGIPVRGITLWMLGGVAELQGEPKTPGADLRIAGVGPLVSLVIGLLFGAVATGMALAGNSGLVLAAFVWLSGINILIAVFNILPAAPLDGGRLLRAALWKWRGDRAWATIVAARAGLGLGFVLIALGLWQFLTVPGAGGLWLALIGWFLLGAAGAEERQARLGTVLSDVRVRDVMTPHPQTAPADISVAEFIDDYVFARRHTAFPIVQEGTPVGLATLDRVRRVPADRRAGTRLRDVACPRSELALTSPDEALTTLLPRLTACADGRALVVDDGQLVGIVSPSDVNHAAAAAGLRSG